MKKLFTLFAAVVAALAMNATKVTFDFSDASAFGYANPAAGAYTQVNNGDVITKDGVTITASFTSGNGVRFFANTNSGVINLREYVGSVLTIAAPAGSTINALSFDGTNLNSTYLSGDVTAKEWTGAASSVTINIIKSTVQINSLVVTLDETPTTTTVDTISVSEAKARIDAGTLGQCYVKGIVYQIDYQYIDTYKNVNCWMTDIDNVTDTLEGYKMKGLNGVDYTSEADVEYAAGDTVLFYASALKKYNTIYEINEGNYADLLGAGPNHGDVPTVTIDTLTVAEAMTLGNSLAASGVSDKVVVVGYVVKAYAYGEKYEGAQTGFMADEVGAFGEFELYNCNVAAPGFVEGDLVAVTGKITKYVSQDGSKTTIEIKNGDVEVIEHATGINDIVVESAAKVIENGQLIIIRNGERYNANGARL